MAQNASINLEDVVPSVKKINESLIRLNEGCAKVNLELIEAHEKTNLGVFDAINKSFAELKQTMAITAENMQNVLLSTEKYVESVAEIDRDDTGLYDN